MLPHQHRGAEADPQVPPADEEEGVDLTLHPDRPAPAGAASAAAGGPAVVATGSGWRRRAPSETLAAFRPHLSAIGVTRLADVTGLDRLGLPVFTAHRPNGRCLAVTQGKGATADAARASAVMEAFEQHCAEAPALALRHAAARELPGETVDLDRLPRLADTWIDRDRPALWAAAEELGTGRPLWVPYELVHLDYRLPLPPALGAFVLSSNGLASGNDRDEALLHALCEVIERDAVALFEAAPDAMSARRVAPDSLPPGAAADALARCGRAGVTPLIWHITSDIGVPAFYVTLVEGAQGASRRLYPASGSGCHPDPGIALMRAVTEAAQSRLTMIAGARDDLGRGTYRDAVDPGLSDRLRALLAAPAPLAFADAGPPPSADLTGAIDDILARLRGAGLPAPVMVDLGRPDLPGAAVRVLAPGLEGPSDAPGRVAGPRARAAAAGGT